MPGAWPRRPRCLHLRRRPCPGRRRSPAPPPPSRGPARATARRAPQRKESRSSGAPSGPLGRGLGFLQQLRGSKLHLVAALEEGGLHKISEQWVRTVRTRSKLGVELARNEPRVIRE